MVDLTKLSDDELLSLDIPEEPSTIEQVRDVTVDAAKSFIQTGSDITTAASRGAIEGTRELGRKSVLLARDIADSVGLTDPKTTQSIRGTINKQRAQFRKDVEQAPLSGIAKGASLGTQLAGELAGAGKIAKPLQAVGGVAGRVASATGAGALLGVFQDTQNRLLEGAKGAAIGGLATKAASFLGNLRPKRLPAAEGARQLSRSQSLGKDPRPAAVKELTGKIKELDSGLKSDKSLYEVLEEGTEQLLTKAQRVTEKSFARALNGTHKAGKFGYDDAIEKTFEHVDDIIASKSKNLHEIAHIIFEELPKTTLQTAHKLYRNRIGPLVDSIIKQSRRGTATATSNDARIASILKAEVKKSILNIADTIPKGTKTAGDALRKADDIFRKLTGPAKQAARDIKTALENGKFEDASAILSKAPSQVKIVKQLRRFIGAEGVKAIETGIVKHAIAKATNLRTLDPKAFAKEMTKLTGEARKFLSKEVRDSIDDIIDLADTLTKNKPQHLNSEVARSVKDFLSGARTLLESKAGKALLTRAAKMGPKELKRQRIMDEVIKIGVQQQAQPTDISDLSDEELLNIGQ